MSIRQQVEDAAFLAQSGKHLGALTNLMLAIAASSRRTFPKGTKSIEQPNDAMSDREAFTLFLGGRIRRLLFGNYGSPEVGNSGISVGFKGNQYDIAYILYKFYRCELVHEGELPEDVEFSPSQKGLSGLSIGQQGLNVSISTGDKMVLDYGWIDLLIQAVVHARCNGHEFGIGHFDLVPKSGITEAEIEQNAVAKYELTPGRFQILKEVVRLVSPDAVGAGDDTALNSRFLEFLQAGQINGGALTGLVSRNLASQAGQLLPKGLAAVREIASSYVLVAA